MTDKEISNIISPLIGQTPWQVHLGWGSFLTFEFGTHIEDAETVHGEWHLWLEMCRWAVKSSEGLLFSSEDTRERIQKVLAEVVWGSISSILTQSPDSEIFATFSSGHSLRTFSQLPADQPQWMLYTPNGMVLASYGAGRLEYVPAEATAEGDG
jgi:hypothetical protein